MTILPARLPHSAIVCSAALKGVASAATSAPAAASRTATARAGAPPYNGRDLFGARLPHPKRMSCPGAAQRWAGAAPTFPVRIVAICIKCSLSVVKAGAGGPEQTRLADAHETTILGPMPSLRATPGGDALEAAPDPGRCRSPESPPHPGCQVLASRQTTGFSPTGRVVGSFPPALDCPNPSACRGLEGCGRASAPATCV
jgi:hypothetical protein